MTNTDWENQLKAGPYDAKAEQIHLNNIQMRISTSAKLHSRLSINRILPLTLLLTIIACVWIFSSILGQQTGNELGKSLSDNDILQIIAQSNPNPNRVILYQENLASNDKLIFSRIETNKNGMTWEVGVIDGETQKWLNAGELEVNYVTQPQYEEGLKVGFKTLSAKYIGAKKGTPFPILYGSYVDPKVTQISISAEDGFKQIAKIIKYGGHSLWYALLPNGSNLELKLEYRDLNGKVIENYTIPRKQ